MHSSPAPSNSFREETYPLIGIICLIGIFLHLLINDPIMRMAGIHYTDEGNGVLEKQHIGTYFILLSFFMLLFRYGNPLKMLVSLYKTERIYTGIFILFVLIISYMIGRSGVKGLSFIIDTQLDAVLAIIILCKTPVKFCRYALYFFIVFAIVNSLIGIGEGITKVRLFTFDADSSVMQDRIFRASAWLGHPLNNAAFSSIMLFVTISSRLSTAWKIAICSLLCVSLISFGGRSALVVSCLGLAALGMIAIARAWGRKNFTLLQIILLVSGAIVIPVGFCAGMVALINSDMGERLSTESSFNDESARARLLAWKAIDYMDTEEIIFGVAPARTTEIRDEMSQSMNLYLIENPWILMFMHLGLIAFPFWFAIMMALMVRLMYGAPLPLKLAVIAYYIIASSSNAFAVKGPTHLIILSAIIFATRALEHDSEDKDGIAKAAIL